MAYMAPEVFSADSRLGDDHSYTEKCDMWSIGVIAMVLLTKDLPFESNDDAKLMECLKNFSTTRDVHTECFNRPEFKKLSDEAQEFLRKLLVEES